MPPAPAAESRVPFWLWAALPVVLAAGLRCRGLGGPEPFTDEGANILTALDPRVREAFEPLAQGRPWLVYLFKPAGWFPANALAVARLMSAGAGLATMAGLGWTLHRLGGRMAALTGLWLWAGLPLAVWHERLALQDPFVTALLAGALALLVVGTEGKRAWPWLAAGGLFGAAFLLKISAALALPWLGIVYLAMQRNAGRPVFDRRLLLIPLGALLPVLTLGTDLWRLGGRLGRYDVLPAVTTGGLLASAGERFTRWLGWYAGYGGWPLLVLLAVALILAARSRRRLALGCAVGWGSSLLLAGLVYNYSYARYALPDHLPLVMFLALALGAAGRARLTALALLVPLARWGFVAWQIGTTPAQAGVPPGEIVQYFTGPWSGRGLGEIKNYLTAYADRHEVRCLVLTHRFLRPGCYGLLLAERGDPRINVVPFTVYEPAELAAAWPGLRHAAAGQRVAFFLLYEGSLYPAHPWLDQAGGPARRVQLVPRGDGENFTLYQFEP